VHFTHTIFNMLIIIRLVFLSFWKGRSWSQYLLGEYRISMAMLHSWRIGPNSKFGSAYTIPSTQHPALLKEEHVVFFLLGDSPASEFYVPTFRNALFHLHMRCKLTSPMKMVEQPGVPKRRHIKFRHRKITQKKEYNIQNTTKTWN